MFLFGNFSYKSIDGLIFLIYDAVDKIQVNNLYYKSLLTIEEIK